MNIGPLHIGWKTVAGFFLLGVATVISEAFPDMFPIKGFDWIAIGGWIKGFGWTLTGIGVRHAIAKIGK